ncbi:MAG: phosphoribosylformylglycinamidine synthase I [Planctomycetia bacterium]
MPPRVLVLRSPGANCDGETAFAFETAGAQVEKLHVNRLVETPALLDEFEVFCVPGGFSYGDDVAAGRILASRLVDRLGDALRAFRDQGKLILGVCNGFQVLLRTDLVVEPDAAGIPRASLAANVNGRFEARWVHVKTTAGRTPFLTDDAVVELPVAHGEGNFVVRDEGVWNDLESAGRVVARYCTPDGGPCSGHPANPNGSLGDAAGLCDATGRVFALMPHPERHVSPYQHPRWTRRRTQPTEGDGLRIFRNAVAYFR